MATIKISEAQQKILKKYLNEDEQTKEMTVNIPMGPDTDPTKAVTKKKDEIQRIGGNPEKTTFNLVPQQKDTTENQVTKEGRIISKAKLTENRRKALKAKSRVYSFTDFIRR